MSRGKRASRFPLLGHLLPMRRHGAGPGDPLGFRKVVNPATVFEDVSAAMALIDDGTDGDILVHECLSSETTMSISA